MTWTGPAGTLCVAAATAAAIHRSPRLRSFSKSLDRRRRVVVPAIRQRCRFEAASLRTIKISSAAWPGYSCDRRSRGPAANGTIAREETVLAVELENGPGDRGGERDRSEHRDDAGRDGPARGAGRSRPRETRTDQGRLRQRAETRPSSRPAISPTGSRSSRSIDQIMAALKRSTSWSATRAPTSGTGAWSRSTRSTGIG